jgi:hypothetical protein
VQYYPSCDLQISSYFHKLEAIHAHLILGNHLVIWQVTLLEILEVVIIQDEQLLVVGHMRTDYH